MPKNPIHKIVRNVPLPASTYGLRAEQVLRVLGGVFGARHDHVWTLDSFGVVRAVPAAQLRRPARSQVATWAKDGGGRRRA